MTESFSWLKFDSWTFRPFSMRRLLDKKGQNLGKARKSTKTFNGRIEWFLWLRKIIRKGSLKIQRRKNRCRSYRKNWGFFLTWSGISSQRKKNSPLKKCDSILRLLLTNALKQRLTWWHDHFLRTKCRATITLTSRSTKCDSKCHSNAYKNVMILLYW